MTDERIIEFINERPVTNKEIRGLLTVVYSLLYIVNKEIKPSECLQKEALDHANTIIDEKLNKSVQNFKETRKDDIEMYDIINEILK